MPTVAVLSFLSGQLKGWVREEPEGSVRTDLMQKNRVSPPKHLPYPLIPHKHSVIPLPRRSSLRRLRPCLERSCPTVMRH
jgi:hypothetical protein